MDLEGLRCHHQVDLCNHGQSLRTVHSQVEEARGRVVTVAMVVRTPWASEDWAWGCDNVLVNVQRTVAKGRDVLAAWAFWSKWANAGQVQLASHATDVLSRTQRT